jgi:hypothetical protein
MSGPRSRPNSYSSLPTSGGSWLKLFRQTISFSNEQVTTPELVGPRLGVSGATVRRWEAGSTTPTGQDVCNLGSEYRLTSTQLAFLKAAFDRSTVCEPASPTEFRRMLRAQVEPFLRVNLPVAVLDGLLFARAWNSYIDVLWTGSSRMLARGAHPLELLTLLAERRRDSVRTADICALVRYFWLATAPQSDSDAYRTLVMRLARHTLFLDCWRALADRGDDSAVEVFDMAVDFQAEDQAIFCPRLRGFIGEPLHLLFEFEPRNGVATQRLQAVQASRPAEPAFNPEPNWT